jgi:aspartate/methionine/tyrosine aminotransferase
MFRVTERVRTIEYAIRDVIPYARAEEKKGKKIVYLNIGDPLKFDFDTPEHIKDALTKAVKDGYNWYSSSEGIPELREAICEKEKTVNNIRIPSENVIVTSGVSEAIHVVMAALVDRGDEILVPGPCYPPYISFSKFFGAKPAFYRTVEENGWQPDVDDARSKVTAKTRGIVIINPNNPCGALYDERVLKELVNLAGEHDILPISDEIYDRIAYEKKFVSVSHIAKDVPVVGLNGFSKVYLMTGWRLGYIYFHNPEGKLTALMENIKKEARVRLCCNTPVQKAAVEALRGPQDHVEELVEKLRKRRDYSWKRLNEIEGMSCAKPEGAFYVFPKVNGIGSQWKDDFEFVRKVLEMAGVLLVHGSGFCPTYGAGHFRATFLPQLGILETAFDSLERFMAMHD